MIDSKKLQSAALGLTLAIVVIGLVGAGLAASYYQDKIYPGVYINNISVGGMTPQAAMDIVSAELPNHVSEPSSISISSQGVTIASSAAELGWRHNVRDTVTAAEAIGKSPFPYRMTTLVKTLLFPERFSTQAEFDPYLADTFLNVFKKQVDQPGVEPQATLRVSGNASTLDIHRGETGLAIDKETAVAMLQDQADQALVSIEVEPVSVNYTLNDEEVTLAQQRATKLVGQKIILRSSDRAFELNDQDLISLLALPSGYRDAALRTQTNKLAAEINRPAQDATFEYNPDTLSVTQFVPHRTGLDLVDGVVQDSIKTRMAEFEVMLAGNTESQTTTPPEITLSIVETMPEKSLENSNELGIKERIGFGESRYEHSIPNRIHNVSLTASRVNNVIVPPGAEFSFNKTLGEVSAATGFRAAYVIRNGKTELGDGGGVCQVSSTLFRALLNAGLPITKRRQHSYRVTYYELNSEPGFDATVYSGDVDLRFVNDTGHHILIHTETDPEDLYMFVELYGTSDGRTTEIVNYRKWDYRPAPAAQYIPTTELPTGKVRQVDWAAAGIRTTFTNIVRDKNGNVLREDTYTSNYVPWSAKFLRGI
jgi:vancomycin resistance protein YoaR